jgi:predicted dehydrogenase
MISYRTAIVGARRGLHHAKAYQGIDNMSVVALCEIDEERRKEGERELHVKGYADYEEMLSKERPDIVHAVTNPNIPRAVWVEPAAAFGVKALVVEKPLAFRPSEAEAMERAFRQTGLKIIVNHQMRYTPFVDTLRELKADGKLGNLHFVRASTQGGILNMATHLMDLVLLMVDDVPPTAVWATVEGGAPHASPDEFCPESLMATYTFTGDIRVFFEASKQAFGTEEDSGAGEKPLPSRCAIDAWGSKGRFWWRDFGSWGYHLDGMAQPFSGPTHFFSDDMPAQRAFTQAIGRWLDDDSKPHRCRFEYAKLGFDAIMAAYRSALKGHRVPFPPRLQDEEWEQLREKLTKKGS